MRTFAGAFTRGANALVMVAMHAVVADKRPACVRVYLLRRLATISTELDRAEVVTAAVPAHGVCRRR
jgi:hypothetical protein